MQLIKEWWFLIAFTIGIFGGLYKMSKTLNETLLKLKFEITRLSDSFASGNSIAGKVDLTLDEFNANTEGLVGFSKMIKAKLVADFDNLEAE